MVTSGERRECLVCVAFFRGGISNCYACSFKLCYSPFNKYLFSLLLSENNALSFIAQSDARSSGSFLEIGGTFTLLRRTFFDTNRACSKHADTLFENENPMGVVTTRSYALNWSLFERGSYRTARVRKSVLL